MVPNFELLRLLVGSLRFTRLKMLKNSARNCSVPASPSNPSFVSFATEKSQFLKAGPLRIFLPAVPNWPTVPEQFVKPGPRHSGDMENMFGLYHWSIVPVITVFGLYGTGV